MRVWGLGVWIVWSDRRERWGGWRPVPLLVRSRAVRAVSNVFPLRLSARLARLDRERTRRFLLLVWVLMTPLSLKECLRYLDQQLSESSRTFSSSEAFERWTMA